MRLALRLVLATILAVGGSNAGATQQVSVADFSDLQAGGQLPPAWEKLEISSIRRHTQYQLVSLDGITVLQADADASMSGLGHKVDVDPQLTPWIHWRWRIAQPNEKSDLHSKQGDDFPARIYVFFDFDIDRLPFFERLVVRIKRAIYGDRLPLAALCYVWASNDPSGTTAWNPHTTRVRTIVASGSDDKAGEWVSVERNVSADYRNAFGEPVPRITGIAIATDSDDTGEHSVAWYGDIVFSNQPQQKQ
jgi:hypothetical protein